MADIKDMPKDNVDALRTHVEEKNNYLEDRLDSLEQMLAQLLTAVIEMYSGVETLMQEITKDMDESEKRAFNTALETIKSQMWDSMKGVAEQTTEEAAKENDGNVSGSVNS